jgi:hypothetical protein
MRRWHDAYDKVAAHPGSADADDIRLTVAGKPDGSMPGYSVGDILCGWQSDDGRRQKSGCLSRTSPTPPIVNRAAAWTVSASISA